jgi:hypothetical protein
MCVLRAGTGLGTGSARPTLIVACAIVGSLKSEPFWPVSAREVFRPRLMPDLTEQPFRTELEDLVREEREIEQFSPMPHAVCPILSRSATFDDVIL